MPRRLVRWRQRRDNGGVSAPPPIELTPDQLRAIAGLEPSTHSSRMDDALRPIGRERLVHLYWQARSALIDAHGPIQELRMAPYRGAIRQPSDPVPPVDQQALAVARAELLVAQQASDAAWARIQRLVDRAQQLLVERKAEK